ncbi:MAG: Fic family protein [Nitrospiraceae bacterium]|nr:Fic family protein [Nitrospiraceae bacterium]
MRNTHCSTAIEDNPLTLEQVRLIEEGQGLPAEPPRAKREVLNYLAGLCHIERPANKKRITHRDVFTLHTMLAAEVMDQGDAGRYTPPAPQLVSGFMAELLAWWNEPSREWSPVISSTVLHYRFEDIHPFADGSGRTGRALALWELYRQGFDTHHIFSVDEVYREDRPAYYAALANVQQQGGDLTEWLQYSARALRVTLDRVWTRTQRHPKIRAL